MTHGMNKPVLCCFSKLITVTQIYWSLTFGALISHFWLFSGHTKIGYALYYYSYNTTLGRAIYMEDLYVMAEFRGTVHCLKNVIVAIKFKKKKHVCMCRKSWVIRAICLSGKGIGKALMSKVAQVSKTSFYYLIETVKKLEMDYRCWTLRLSSKIQ